jgi:hypothetical protein
MMPGSLCTIANQHNTSLLQGWYPEDIKYNIAEKKYDWSMLLVSLAALTKKDDLSRVMAKSERSSVSRQKVQDVCKGMRDEHQGLFLVMEEIASLADDGWQLAE